MYTQVAMAQAGQVTNSPRNMKSSMVDVKKIGIGAVANKPQSCFDVSMLLWDESRKTYCKAKYAYTTNPNIYATIENAAIVGLGYETS
mmetsp:Transcript_9343/g.14090  ORF Transcript_9343/g.14090 Transcript_9343/m.14090 type:complete len:88 (-) Transcript_9343:492-755(-)